MVDYADTGRSSDPEGKLVGAPKMELLEFELSSGAGCSKPEFELSSGAGCSKPIGESIASSSWSRLKQDFVDMGFSSTVVDKVLKEKGEANAELLLESLIAYSDVKRSNPDSPDSIDEIFGDCKAEGTSPNCATISSEVKELDAAFQDKVDRRTSLLMMNFSVQEVDFALDKLGEDSPVNEIVDFIVAAQVAEISAVDDKKKIEDSTTETLFCTMDMTLRLLEMGFTDDEISSAIDKYGAEIPVAELADSIFANRIADACFENDKDPPVHLMNQSHAGSYRPTLQSPKEEYDFGPFEEYNKRRSFNTFIAETQGSSSNVFLHAEDITLNGIRTGKKPKLEYEDYSDSFLGASSPEVKSYEPKSTSISMSLPHKLSVDPVDGLKIPHQLGRSNAGGIREMVANRPYFFYGNVLDVSHETWKKLSQFLFAFDPEFVNTQFFSALSRKEGYIHNLPKGDRSHILPRSPMTIEEAMPRTTKWWPSWDTRKQLSCINSETKGISQMCARLEKILIDSQGMVSKEQQTDILHHCKSLNLVWVGLYKLNPIGTEQVERIFGYPMCHTESVVSDPVERLGILKHSFQIDTLGYHLSALKWIFPDGLTILSLYSGIGGAEIAIHRLGLRLKGVVSVESSEKNRRILRRWWQNTGQTGELVQIEDINKLTSVKVKNLIQDFGGFDLVICQNPFTHIPGMVLNPENPSGFDFASFFEFVRVLQSVRNIMGCR